jgi:hypothetical protein
VPQSVGAYGGGRCKHWVNVKNRAHPAYSRARDALLSAPATRAR